MLVCIAIDNRNRSTTSSPELTVRVYPASFPQDALAASRAKDNAPLASVTLALSTGLNSVIFEDDVVLYGR